MRRTVTLRDFSVITMLYPRAAGRQRGPRGHGNLGSFPPGGPRAQSLGGPHAALVIEPALARPRRGPARLARLGGDEGAADELDQALLRIAAGSPPRGGGARGDQGPAPRGGAPAPPGGPPGP